MKKIRRLKSWESIKKNSAGMASKLYDIVVTGEAARLVPVKIKMF